VISSITARELHEWLQRDAKPVVLDVREAHELAICALAQAQHIPMGQITARLNDIDKNAEVVVMCHHGMRSLQVAQYLTRAGFTKVYNLTGGIHAWANDVDPAMARY
jgi:rhodanese-related sulfurtransferase